MTTLTKENQELLTKQLSEALIRFSDRAMSSAMADKVASIALKNVDINNSTLAHKGINWYAKDLLKRIKFN